MRQTFLIMVAVVCVAVILETLAFSQDKWKVNIEGNVYYVDSAGAKHIAPVPVKLIRERDGQSLTLLESQVDEKGKFTLLSSSSALGGEYKVFVEFETDDDDFVYQGYAITEVSDSKDFDPNWIFKWKVDIVAVSVKEKTKGKGVERASDYFSLSEKTAKSEQKTAIPAEKRRIDIAGKVYYKDSGGAKHIAPVPVKLIRERSGQSLTLLENQADEKGEFILQSSNPALGGEYKAFAEFELGGFIYQGYATTEVPDSKDFDPNWTFKWRADIVCEVAFPMKKREQIERVPDHFVLRRDTGKPSEKQSSPDKSKAMDKKTELIQQAPKLLESHDKTDRSKDEKTATPRFSALHDIPPRSNTIFERKYKQVNAQKTKSAKSGGVDNVVDIAIAIPDEFVFETHVRVNQVYHLTRWCPSIAFSFRKEAEPDHDRTLADNIHFTIPQCRQEKAQSSSLPPKRTFDLVDYAIINRNFLWHLFYPGENLYKPVPPHTVAYTSSQPVLFFEKEWGKINIIKQGDKITFSLDDKPVREIKYPKPLGYFSSSVAYMDVEFKDMTVTAGGAHASKTETCLPFVSPMKEGDYRLNPPDDCGYGADNNCATRDKAPLVHAGIDFFANKDKPHPKVYATAKGRVVFKNENQGKKGRDHTGFGNAVVIEHDLGGGRKVFSQYSHLHEINMNKEAGDSVEAGDLIGTGGATGFGKPEYWNCKEECKEIPGKAGSWSTKCERQVDEKKGACYAFNNHLHFEIKDNHQDELKLKKYKDNPAFLILTNPKSHKNYTDTYFGYTQGNPDNFGYHDPLNYLNRNCSASGENK